MCTPNRVDPAILRNIVDRLRLLHLQRFLLLRVREEIQLSYNTIHMVVMVIVMMLIVVIVIVVIVIAVVMMVIVR